MASFAPKFSVTPIAICSSNHTTSIFLRNYELFTDSSSFRCRKLHSHQQLSVSNRENGGGGGGYGVGEMERAKLKRVRVVPKLSEEQKRAIAQLPPKMTSRCKALMKEIVCFSAESGSVPRMLAAWVRNTKPQRADWLAVLKELERMNHSLYFEVWHFLFL